MTRALVADLGLGVCAPPVREPKESSRARRSGGSRSLSASALVLAMCAGSVGTLLAAAVADRSPSADTVFSVRAPVKHHAASPKGDIAATAPRFCLALGGMAPGGVTTRVIKVANSGKVAL